MSTTEIKLSGDDLKRIREKKFILMRLKEEWEMAGHNLVNRKSLMLGHVAAASLTVLIGISLLVILEYNATNKVIKIAISSVTAAGGVLALIIAIKDKAAANKDYITKILQVMKNDGNEGSHELITIEENELIDLKTERHENYIKFLIRINYLIRLEKRFGVWFVILMSLLVIVLAIITILVSVSPVDLPFPNLSIYLAIGIIISGAVWLINIILSHLIELFEIASNIHWESADVIDDYAPIALFYLIMKRTYVVTEDVNETYFGEFRTGNDDVTFFGTEIDARPILELVMLLDKKFRETSVHEIRHENVEIIVKSINEMDKEKIIELINILVRKPGGTVVMLAERFKDIIDKIISKFEPNHDDIKKFISSIDKDELDKDILFEIFKYEITRNKKLSKLIDLAMTVAKEMISKNQSNLAKSQEKKVFDIYKKHKPSNRHEALNLKESEQEFSELCKEYTKANDEDEAIINSYKQYITHIYDTYKTENDDEAMKLVIKIIEKNCNFNEYLTKHNKKFLSFRKIYRYDIKENFWKLFKKMTFKNKIRSSFQNRRYTINSKA
ncbi:983_t:CDS:2 [Cetraspora pellucida]|uniref:983_t:CDS:1 n=1 Tax=Cetraspora pellucida TaxID=1433469 RepID=A0ACA9L4R7_9GLOM|nr:983_t:CDS:2 [Cetraspora pellucida]